MDFFSEPMQEYLSNATRTNMSNEDLRGYYEYLNSKIKNDFQILEKNELKDPEQVLSYLSGKAIMMTNLVYEEKWDRDRISEEMKKMVTTNYLSYCSEVLKNTGRVNYNVNQIEPWDEKQMIKHIQIKGPLLVLVNGNDFQRYKKGEIIEPRLHDTKSA